MKYKPEEFKSIGSGVSAISSRLQVAARGAAPQSPRASVSHLVPTPSVDDLEDEPSYRWTRRAAPSEGSSAEDAEAAGQVGGGCSVKIKTKMKKMHI